MASNPIIFAGMEISSGRKPITLARLDADLKVAILETSGLSEALSRLQNHESLTLAVDVPVTKAGQQLYTDLKGKLTQAGFKASGYARPWLETRAQDCFQALGGGHLFPKRSLEGRLQRCAILYEQGLQITDPIDMLEEMTRYRLIRGILPLENLPSSKELDALITAYLAWMAVNRPRQMSVQGEIALPAQEESFLSGENLERELDE